MTPLICLVCDDSFFVLYRMENSAEVPDTQSNVISEHLDIRSASRGRAGRSSDELDTTFSCGEDWKETSAAVAEDNEDDRCSRGDAEIEEEEREYTWKGNNGSGRSERHLELTRQTDSDEQLNETKDAEEDDEKSQSSYVQVPDDRRRPESEANDNSSENNHSTNSQQAFRKDRKKQETQVSRR